MNWKVRLFLYAYWKKRVGKFSNTKYITFGFYNLSFQIVIYHTITSKNCNNDCNGIPTHTLLVLKEHSTI